MSHEPITLKIDPTSTEKYTDSGILTDDIANPITGIPPAIPNILCDEYFSVPMFIGKIDFTAQFKEIISFDPFTDWSFGGIPKYLPFQVFNLLSHYFHDYVPVVTFQYVKHPTVRGKHVIEWHPGVLSLTDPLYGSKIQRWLIDLEKDDEFSVTLPSPKNNAFRTLQRSEAIKTPDGVTWVNHTRDTSPLDDIKGGTVRLTQLSLDIPIIAPAVPSVLVYLTFTEVRAAEFRGIQSVATQPHYPFFRQL